MRRPQTPAPPGETFVLQFKTAYRAPDGSSRLRVVTTARTWASRGDEEVRSPSHPNRT